MLIPIVTDKNLLKKICKRVYWEEGIEIGELLVEQLKLRSKEAVGLAAPQIGIDAQVFAMKKMRDFKPDEFIYYINPIIRATEDLHVSEEGCLSLPGIVTVAIRNNVVHFKDDAHGDGTWHNFHAWIFQHEYDHLQGVLMTDREPKPYAPCPCTSGKKWKFCHKEKHKEALRLFDEQKKSQ